MEFNSPPADQYGEYIMNSMVYNTFGHNDKKFQDIRLFYNLLGHQLTEVRVIDPNIQKAVAYDFFDKI